MVSKKAEEREFFKERYWSLKQRDRIEYLLHLDRIEKSSNMNIPLFYTTLILFYLFFIGTIIVWDAVYFNILNQSTKIVLLCVFSFLVLLTTFNALYMIILGMQTPKAIKKLNKRFNHN